MIIQKKNKNKPCKIIASKWYENSGITNLGQKAVVEKLKYVWKEREFKGSKGTRVLSWFHLKDLGSYRISSLEDNHIRTVMKYFKRKRNPR